ncbi:MAG: hypothetical protein JWR00_4725 [Rubritepida sp.]|nr:hypothetical protein [Rubritepida sp.]
MPNRSPDHDEAFRYPVHHPQPGQPTEELGWVYESLLELHPIVQVATRPWIFAFAGDEAAGDEGAFWRSLKALSGDSQIIVFDNKEPPANVAMDFKYEFFAGPDAGPTDRPGFIPQ